MALIRVQFFYTQGRYGWQELFYNRLQTLNGVFANAVELAVLRRQLLNNDARLEFIRASDDLNFRDSEVTASQGTVGGIAGFQWVVPSVHPWSAFLVRLSAGSFTRRNLYLRGLPDFPLNTPKGPTVSPTWYTAYQSWRNKLLNGNWGVRAFKKPIPPWQMMQYPPNSAGSIPISTAGFLSGDRIIIKGFVALPYINRIWVVDVVDTTHLVLRNFKPKTPIPLLADGAKLRKVDYEIIPFTDIGGTRMVSRKTGRPFDSPLGRRRRV